MGAPDITNTQKQKLKRRLIERAGEKQKFVPIKEGPLKGRMAFVNVRENTRQKVMNPVEEGGHDAFLSSIDSPAGRGTEEVGLNFSFKDFLTETNETIKSSRSKIRESPTTKEALPNVQSQLTDNVTILNKQETEEVVKAGTLYGDNPGSYFQDFSQQFKGLQELQQNEYKRDVLEEREDVNEWALTLDPGAWIGAAINATGRAAEELSDLPLGPQVQGGLKTVSAAEKLVADLPDTAESETRSEQLLNAAGSKFDDLFNVFWDGGMSLIQEAAETGEGVLEVSGVDVGNALSDTVEDAGDAFETKKSLAQISSRAMRGVLTTMQLYPMKTMAIGRESLNTIAGGIAALTEEDTTIQDVHNWQDQLDGRQKGRSQFFDDHDKNVMEATFKDATRNILEDYMIRTGRKAGKNTEYFNTINDGVRLLRAMKETDPYKNVDVFGYKVEDLYEGIYGERIEGPSDITAEAASGALAGAGGSIGAGMGLILAGIDGALEVGSKMAEITGDEKGAKELSNTIRTKEYFTELWSSLSETNFNEPNKPAFESLAAYGGEFLSDPVFVLGMLGMKLPSKIGGRLKVLNDLSRFANKVDDSPTAKAAKQTLGNVDEADSMKSSRLASDVDEFINENFSSVDKARLETGKAVHGVAKFINRFDELTIGAPLKLGKNLLKWGFKGAKEAKERVSPLGRQIFQTFVKKGPTPNNLSKLWTVMRSPEAKSAGREYVARLNNLQMEEMRPGRDRDRVELGAERLEEAEVEGLSGEKARQIKTAQQMVKRLDNLTESTNSVAENFLNRSGQFQNLLAKLPSIRVDSLFKTLQGQTNPKDAPGEIRTALVDHLLRSREFTNRNLELISEQLGKMDENVPAPVRDMVQNFRESEVPQIREAVKRGEREQAAKAFKRMDHQNPYNKELDQLTTDMLRVEDAQYGSRSFKLGRENSLRHLFMSRLADEFGGDVLDRTRTTKEVLGRAFDLMLDPSVSKRLNDLVQRIPAIRRLTEGKFSTNREAAREVVEGFLNDMFTKRGRVQLDSLVRSEKGTDASTHLTDMLQEADRRFFQDEAPRNRPEPFRTTQRESGDAGPNLAASRIRPFQDLVRKAREFGGIRSEMKFTDPLRSVEVLSANLPDGDLNITPRQQVVQTGEAIAFAATKNGDLADTIRNSLDSEIERKVNRSVEEMRMYSDNADILEDVIRNELTSKGEELVGAEGDRQAGRIRRIMDNLKEANPTQPDQLVQHLMALKRADVIESSPEMVLKEFESRLLERLKGLEEGKERPGYGEYFREGPDSFDDQPFVGRHSPEYADIREFQLRQKNTTGVGVSPREERQVLQQFVEDNIGHESHEAVVGDIMKELDNQVTHAAKRLGLVEAFSKHPDFEDVLSGIEDETVKHHVGELIEQGMLDVVKELNPEDMTMEGAVRLRDGALKGLPPEEAQTYITQVLSGVPSKEAMRNAVRAFNARLDAEAPQRLDGIDKIAFIEHLKDQRPMMKDSLNDAQNLIENHIFEEYTQEMADVFDQDQARRQHDSLKDIMDSIEGQLPQEVVDQIRNKTDRGEFDVLGAYREWAENLREKHDVPRAEVEQFTRTFFDRNIDELNDTQWPQVIDYLKSSDRASYTPRQLATPTPRLVEAYRSVGVDFFNPGDMAMHKHQIGSQQLSESEVEERRQETLRKIEEEQNAYEDRIQDRIERMEDESTMGEDFPGMSKWVHEVSKKWSLFGESVETALRRMGDEGDEAANMLLGKRNLASQWEQGGLRVLQNLQSIWETSGLDGGGRDMKEKLRQSIEGVKDEDLIERMREETGNPNWGTPVERLQHAVEEARDLGGDDAVQAFRRVRDGLVQLYDRRGRIAEEAGMEVWDVVDGNMTKRPFKRRENYFPHLAPLDGWSDSRRQAYLRSLLEEKFELEPEEADASVREMIDEMETKVAGSLDYNRILEEDGYIKDPFRATRLYISDFSNRIAELQVFGKDEIKLKDLLSRITEQHGSEVGQYAKELINLQVRGHDLSHWQRDWGDSKLFRAVQTINLMQMLDLATINNAMQAPMASLLATDYYSAIHKGIQKLAQDPQRRELVRQSGANIEHYIRELGHESNVPVMNQMFRYNMLGFTTSELMQRKMAASIGLENAQMLLDDLRAELEKGKGRGDADVDVLIDRLDRTGYFDGFETSSALSDIEFDAVEAARRGHFTEIEKKMIMNRFVNKTQFRRQNIDVPRIANLPMAKVFTQFQFFPFKWLKLIKDETVGKFYREFKARTGEEFNLFKPDVFRKEFFQSAAPSFTTLYGYGMLGLPTGKLLHAARAKAAGRGQDMYNEGVFTYLSAVGGLGYAENFLNAYAYETNLLEEILGTIGGPSVGRVLDARGKMANNGLEGLNESLARSLIKFVPAGQIIEQRWFRGSGNRADDITDVLWLGSAAIDSLLPFTDDALTDFVGQFKTGGFPDPGPRREYEKVRNIFTEGFSEPIFRSFNHVLNEGIEATNALTGQEVEKETTRLQRQREYNRARNRPTPN